VGQPFIFALIHERKEGLASLKSPLIMQIIARDSPVVVYYNSPMKSYYIYNILNYTAIMIIIFIGLRGVRRIRRAYHGESEKARNYAKSIGIPCKLLALMGDFRRRQSRSP
jgi:hypothetical protein